MGEHKIQLPTHETVLSDSGGWGEPLVLLHALGVNHHIWRDVAHEIGQKRRCLSYDLRGHGAAKNAPPAVTLQDLADDLAALLKTSGIARAHVAGLSMGGSIAQYFGLSYGDMALSLALIASPSKTVPQVFEERAKAAEASGMAPLVGPTLERWFSRAALTAEIAGVRDCRKWLQEARVSGYAASLRALGRLDTFERLHQVRLPAKCIAGEFDPGVTPEAMREIASRIPGATYHLVRGALHMIPLEKPRELAKLLLQ